MKRAMPTPPQQSLSPAHANTILDSIADGVFTVDETGKIAGGVETFRNLYTLEALQKEIKRAYTFGDILCKNHQILKIFDILPQYR